MRFFITPDGRYYEGDQAHQLDVAVSQRPDFTYDWDGVQWIKNPDKEPKPIPSKPTLDTEIDAIRTVDDVKAFLKARITERIAPVDRLEVAAEVESGPIP
jgi:hypothetical protein